MSLRVFLLSVFAAVFSPAKCQLLMPQVDSLQRVLRSALPDSTRSLVLAELAYRYYTNPDSTFVIARRGLKLAEALQFGHGIANNQFALAISYYNTADFLKASELSLNALAFHQRHNFTTDLARCYMMLGVIQSKQNNFRGGIKSMLKSQHHFQVAGDLDGELRCLNNIGYYYTIENQYDSSYYYLTKGVRLAAFHNEKLNLISLTGSLAELYLAMKDPANAEKNILQSISINENHDPVLQAYNYNLLAKVYLLKGDQAGAMKAVQNALLIEKRSRQNEHEPATYGILSELYAARGEFSLALQAHRTSSKLEKLIFSHQKEQEHANMLHRFELEEKENQIKILQQSAALSQLNVQMREQEISAQRLYLIGFGFIVLLIGAFLLIISRQSRWRKKYIRKLQDKKMEIEAQASQLDEANRELDVLNKRLTAHSENITSKIENYAFLNSHKLRAPVASLIGLLQLIKDGAIDESEAKFVHEALREQVMKLDRVVGEITRAIE